MVAVQVVTRRGRSLEQIEHVRFAHGNAELALLLAAAREPTCPGLDVLDVGHVPVGSRDQSDPPRAPTRD